MAVLAYIGLALGALTLPVYAALLYALIRKRKAPALDNGFFKILMSLACSDMVAIVANIVLAQLFIPGDIQDFSIPYIKVLGPRCGAVKLYLWETFRRHHISRFHAEWRLVIYLF